MRGCRGEWAPRWVGGRVRAGGKPRTAHPWRCGYSAPWAPCLVLSMLLPLLPDCRFYGKQVITPSTIVNLSHAIAILLIAM